MGIGEKATVAELKEFLERLKLQVTEAAQPASSAEGPATADNNEAISEDDSEPGAAFSSVDDHSTRVPSINESSTLHYDNGDTFEGAVLDGSIRHGWGIHTCLSGEVYKGSYRLDERHGKGLFTAADGTSYDGSWQHDKAHGQGTAKYADGSRYEGEWHQGSRQGWGSFWTASGEHYEGEWHQDMMHGNGCWTFAKNDGVFEGRFCKGQRVQGRLVRGGFEYDGSFESNEPHGQGIGTHEGLWTYNGTWAASQRHGQGECRYFDGGYYIGGWHEDARHGTGVLRLPGGYVYQGEWQNDKPHGTGSCKYDNGERYSGQWHEGKRHGMGRCLFSNGDRHEGCWADDEREGEGICVYADGSKYQGSWKAGKRHGPGFAIFADGVRFRGQWDDDAWVQSAADPKLTRLKGPGLSRAVAGQAASFAIQARDDANSRRLNGGDTFSIVLEGADGTEVARGRVTDNDDGTYLATYVLTKAGPHHVHVLSGDGEPVADSPYQIIVKPGAPVARHSRAEGPGRRAAVLGAAATFCVRACDAYGNHCDVAGAELSHALQLQAQLVRGGEVLPVTCQAAAAGGLIHCSYTPVHAGLHVLEVTAGGKHITGSPFSVQVHPQLQLPARSSTHQQDTGPASHRSHSASTDNSTALVLGGGIVDKVAWWGRVASAEYAADGSLAGYESDEEAGQQDAQAAPEEGYIKANPDVAVVERMEDMWRLSKLQQERQRKAAQQQQAAPKTDDPQQTPQPSHQQAQSHHSKLQQERQYKAAQQQHTSAMHGAQQGPLQSPHSAGSHQSQVHELDLQCEGASCRQDDPNSEPYDLFELD